jgi:hypothetical protein
LDAPRWKRPIDYWLLWVAVIVLAVVNYQLITTLLTVRQQVTTQVADAAESAAQALDGMKNATIDYPVEIRQAIPISMTINYTDTIVVPISYTLPVNTNVSVPLRTPLGTFPINVPINMSVPVRFTPTVPLDIKVPVSLTVPVNIDVPIHVDLSTTPLGEGLADVQSYLYDAAEQIRTGGLGGPITATVPVTITVTVPVTTTSAPKSTP